MDARIPVNACGKPVFNHPTAGTRLRERELSWGLNYLETLNYDPLSIA